MRKQFIKISVTGWFMVYLVTALSQGFNPIEWSWSIIFTFASCCAAFSLGVSGMFFIDGHYK